MANAIQCREMQVCAFGQYNRHYNYFVGEDPIQTSYEEKD